jgi:hypothetical protein
MLEMYPSYRITPTTKPSVVFGTILSM